MDISQEVRSLVIEKFKKGVKQKDICVHLKLNKSAVSKLIKRFKTTGMSLLDEKDDVEENQVCLIAT